MLNINTCINNTIYAKIRHDELRKENGEITWELDHSKQRPPKSRTLNKLKMKIQ
jgi:hypothetical protein